MNAVEKLSKTIAWIIITTIKIIIYPIYKITDVISKVCKYILDAISNRNKEVV